MEIVTPVRKTVQMIFNVGQLNVDEAVSGAIAAGGESEHALY